MIEDRPKHVLFLCTGNSARSILAEALMTDESGGRFIGHSAGSQPTGQPNPFALATLERLGHRTSGLHSKSWDAFGGPDAPPMDVIITVCDNAAGETCPFWPGHPATAHWGLPDPAAIDGSDTEKQQAFDATYDRLKARIGAFLALPFDEMDDAGLAAELDRIGQLED